MKTYFLRIRRRRDGLFVAAIPGVSKVGYGLNQDEALHELVQALRRTFAGGREDPGLPVEPLTAG